MVTILPFLPVTVAALAAVAETPPDMDATLPVEADMDAKLPVEADMDAKIEAAIKPLLKRISKLEAKCQRASVKKHAKRLEALESLTLTIPEIKKRNHVSFLMGSQGMQDLCPVPVIECKHTHRHPLALAVSRSSASAIALYVVMISTLL